ncbi:S8 family peptidase [Demetria terragena]|uniref:S8 family peptidase n=1 Tax=Demetria terragena TaxID=63959 RepID=UPI00036A270D|nr:S8 family serine peptidase [Demetria terragena]
MTHPSRTRRRLLGLATTVALASAVALGSTAGTTAEASPASDPPSTPVDTAPADGTLMSYVVNLKEGQVNDSQLKRAERVVTKAGGVVVQSWPQIGVIVAHSTKAAFVDNLPKGTNSPIKSAGQTRTTAVAEGTPGTDSEDKSPSRSRKASVERTDTTGHEQATKVKADPREGEQWGNKAIKANRAHKISGGSSDVVVGVVDSGVDGLHPDLVSNFRSDKSVSCQNAGVPERKNWGPTTSSHGTHVAGTIGAARNGEGIVGIAPNTAIAAVKVVNDGGFIYPEYAVCGMMWSAMQGIDVTNNSYYVDPWAFWCSDQANQAPGMEAVRRAMSYATYKGVAHVAASGNSTYDLANKTTDTTSPNDSKAVSRQLNKDCLDLPTEVPGTVSVSSVSDDKAGITKSGFSNYGKGKITVAAPGANILSTLPNGQYGSSSGTSMASPHVAGVLALLKATHPKASPERLIGLLKSQATEMPCDGDTCAGPDNNNGYYGHGLVDALKAVK